MARYSRLTYGLVGAFFGTPRRQREEAESEEKAYQLYWSSKNGHLIKRHLKH